MKTKFETPKAKKLYIAYNIDNPDDLMTFRTPEAAIEETDPENEEVYAVYEFVGLVKIKRSKKIIVTKVE